MFTFNNYLQKSIMSKILCKRQILWLNMSESFDSQDKKDKHDPQQNG